MGQELRIERSARGLVPTAVAPAGCKSKCHCEHRYIIDPHCNSSEAVYEDMRHICLSSSRKAGLTTMPPRPCNQLPTSQPTGQPGNRRTSRPISRPASPTQSLSHATHQPPSQPASLFSYQSKPIKKVIASQPTSQPTNRPAGLPDPATKPPNPPATQPASPTQRMASHHYYRICYPWVR